MSSKTWQKHLMTLPFLVLILTPGMARSAGALPPEGPVGTSYKQSEPESHPFSILTVGALIKLQAQERAIKTEIQRLIREVQKCDAGIARAKEIVSKARKAGNGQAERLASESIIKSEKAKDIYLKQGVLANRKIARINGEKQRLSTVLLNRGSELVRGAVSRAYGDVAVHSPDRDREKPLSADHVEPLHPGGEVSTGRGAQAELQLLGGRASMAVSENSRAKIEDDGPDSEVVRTLKGTFHFMVEKKAALQTDLEHGLAPLLDKAGQVLDKTDQSYAGFLGRIKARMEKKLQVKVRSGGTCSVRGTEFVVTEHLDGSSEINVIEGIVTMTDPTSGKETLVATGQGVVVSPEGIPQPVHAVDAASLPKWWEEQQ